MQNTSDSKNDKHSAEKRLNEMGIKLPVPPGPFGAYVEAVETGNLLFLTGMLPTEGRVAKFYGRVGAEFDVESGRAAARLAALNVLAVAREHLGSLDRISRVVKLGVSIATWGDFLEHRRSLMVLPSCSRTFLEKIRIRAEGCLASRVFHWVHPSNWKLSSR